MDGRNPSQALFSSNSRDGSMRFAAAMRARARRKSGGASRPASSLWQVSRVPGSMGQSTKSCSPWTTGRRKPGSAGGSMR
jgi:hypothetical protein